MANTETETLYRIHWKARLTSATGHGTGSWPKEQAQHICDSMNKDPETSKWTTHWIEPVPGPTPDPERGEK